jgi:hypothetical protein
LLWSGLDSWRAEVAQVDLTQSEVRARGTQLGIDPVPYRLDYKLEAGDQFVTRWLEVEVTGAGWARRLDLRHDGAGNWVCQADEQGNADLPPAGGDLEAVTGAVDCDLGRSPMTNLMPVRRHALHERSASVDFLMAWVSVPDLSLHPSRQRYEHVQRGPHGSVVRYVGAHRSFVGDLELDQDGLVLVYPQLAKRVGGPREYT